MSEQIYSLLLDRKTNANSDIYVFPNKTSTSPIISVRRQKDTSIKKRVYSLRIIANINFAMLLKKELGIDTNTISILLNHSPQGVTQRHYLTSSPKDYKNRTDFSGHIGP